MTRRFVLLLTIFFCGLATAQTPVRTKVFPGAQALPLIAGVQQGIFERHGIKLDLLFTASSQELRDGLASGEPFDFHGEHYAIDGLILRPTPVQRPRVPVWVVGAWPHERSLRRAARWDGLLPTKVGRGVETPFTPEDLVDVVAGIRPLREAAGLDWDSFDVVAESVSEPGSAGDAKAREWVDAGATWWVESDWSMGEDAAQVHRRRIDAGPPSP